MWRVLSDEYSKPFMQPVLKRVVQLAAKCIRTVTAHHLVSVFLLAYICDFMRVSTSGFTYESLLGCNLARWRH